MDDSSRYLISSREDWNKLSELVYSGVDLSGVTFLQTEDFTIDVMVGTADHPFSGIYDGDGHTLTAALEDTSQICVAPFREISGATIRNLRIDGSVLGKQHAAGLVGLVDGNCEIIDCAVTADVTVISHGQDSGEYCAGFVGHGGTGTTTITGCVFDGALHPLGASGGTYHSAAFFGWADEPFHAYLTDCLDLSDSAWPLGLGTTSADHTQYVTVENCYYISHDKAAGSDRPWPEGSRGERAFRVLAAGDVTMALYGSDSWEYPVSGLRPGSDGGLLYHGRSFYASAGTATDLDLRYRDSISDFEGFCCTAEDSLEEDGDHYTLTMPNENAVIRAKWADGIPYLAPTLPDENGNPSVLYCPEEYCTDYEGQDQMNAYIGWYVVRHDVTVDSIININGDVNLILMDGATLTAKAGVSVNEGCSLTVWAQSDAAEKDSPAGALLAGTDGRKDADGEYNVTCSPYNAGIGSCHAYHLTVNGGFITATGGYFSAGIGGGNYGDGGVITIEGGTVKAAGGAFTSTSVSGGGAGIGGGSRASGGKITITGGTVTASAKNGAQAIGRGDENVYFGTTPFVPGELDITGMKVCYYDDPDNIQWLPAGEREDACRNDQMIPVRLEPCAPVHVDLYDNETDEEESDGYCDLCGHQVLLLNNILSGTYSGTALPPVLDVSFGEDELAENENYTVTYFQGDTAISPDKLIDAGPIPSSSPARATMPTPAS